MKIIGRTGLCLLSGEFSLTTIKKFYASKLFIPVVLLFFCVLAHGLLIPFLGFYWDDWPMIWFAETQGPLGFPAAFSGDRPFLSGVYILTTSILGSTPLPWHILGLITRWLLGLSIWWFIRELWPDRKNFAFWVGLLSIIYPAFKQQPIAVVYSNGLFLLISYFASFSLMLMAMRSRRKKDIILLYLTSVFAYTFCLFSTEYYIGLDVVRGLVIWLRIEGNSDTLRKKILKGVQIWLPYLLILGVFLVWRVIIFKFPTYQPVLIETLYAPDGAGSPLLMFLYRFIRDPFLAAWQGWSTTFHFPQLSDFQVLSQTLTWLIIIISSVIAGLLLYKTPTNTAIPAHRQTTWHKEIFAISLVALFFAGWPFWITNLPIELAYPYDRFLLAFLFGSCLFIAGIIEWAIRKRSQKVILLALITGMAVGANFENANSYRREWQTHNQFIQQLSWRIPDLEPGTMLLTYNLPFKYYSDNSLTAPLNLLYAPDNHSLNLDYYLGLAPVRLGRSIPTLEKDLPIEQNFRNARFSGNTNNMLVFFYSPPGCLRILDPERDANLTILPKEYKDAIAFSNLTQIMLESSTTVALPQSISSSEDDKAWCYYFEKADLAKQAGNWESAANWIETAYNLGLSPAEPSEMLVYVEALYNADQVNKAVGRSLDLFYTHPELSGNICELTRRISASKAEITSTQVFQDMLDTIDCLIK